MRLTNRQWNRIAPQITHIHRLDRRGKERIDDRIVLEGILWILITGAQWRHLPQEYPSYQTCHRRFQEWRQDGTIERILRALATDLEKKGILKTQEAFVDGSIARAKKGGLTWVVRSPEKAVESWLFQMLARYPSLSM